MNKLPFDEMMMYILH